MITLDSLDLKNTSPETLGELLISAKKAYYTSSKPIMDDHTYDTLEEILRIKSPYHRLFTKVGHPNFDTGFDKKPHHIPMGSQNKVNTFTDLIKYFHLNLKRASSNVSAKQADYVVQPKCDGISLEIIYKNGQLVEAITRGDGQIGDVVTQNVIKMKNFINHPHAFTGSIRCEIVVTNPDFKKLNEIVKVPLSQGGMPEGQGGFYSNPRNAASGISQRLDSKYSEYCSLFAVDISSKLNTETEKINLLQSLGFTTVDSVFCTSYQQIEDVFQKYLKNRSDYLFEIDGLVIKIDNVSLQNQLGSLNGRPKFQVAYKFPSSSNQSRIIAINWQVGPLGTITPVAQIDPIELSGAIISFASLANYKLIKDKDINIGDIIQVSRRGDVIPHIEKVVTKVSSGSVIPPTHCPSCHTLLIVENKFLRCPNHKTCLAQILGSLRLFCDTLEIKGLSDKTIAKLYQAGCIRLPGDFYKLSVNDIKDLENLGEISAKNIINQIQAKKILSVVEIFHAAAIPNFSHKRIKQLIKAGFNNPDKLLNISITQLESLPGIQITLAQKIFDGINSRRPQIESILSQINLKFVIHNLKLKSLTFCITGKLSHPRKDIEKLIENNGGQVLSTVTKNTNYLICNETDLSSSKYLLAKKLNVPIISETEFYQLL